MKKPGILTLNLIVICLLSLVGLKAGAASVITTDSLAVFMEGLSSNEKFMGQVEVMKDGKTIHFYGTGYTDVNAQTKTTANSKYMIGSVSKTITASMVLKAVEEEKLKLEGKLSEFFPEIKHADQITIEQLLNHHSGIHNLTQSPDYAAFAQGKKSREELIDFIVKGGSDFLPGEKAAYSNSNYILLSYILEKVYNLGFDQIFQKKIVDPLGLKFSQFGMLKSATIQPTLSYKYEAEWVPMPTTDSSIPMGAGGIVMNAHDLATYITALFDGKIISTPSLEKMTTQKDGYGLGIFKTAISGKTGYTHTGLIDGFNAAFYYLPEERLTYILLSNAENYNLDKINKMFLNISLGLPTQIPSINPYKVEPQDMASYTGIYTSEINPLIITVSEKNNKLLAQPKGQQVYSMDATELHTFTHEKTGVTLLFDPKAKTMLLKQGNFSFSFTKKE